MSEIKKFETREELEAFKQANEHIYDFPYEYIDMKRMYVVECVKPCQTVRPQFTKRVY
jgi:hypothetical protein